jgi:hypothetical protein
VKTFVGDSVDLPRYSKSMTNGYALLEISDPVISHLSPSKQMQLESLRAT